MRGSLKERGIQRNNKSNGYRGMMRKQAEPGEVVFSLLRRDVLSAHTD